MYEAPIRPTKMNDVERRQFVQKAKADRLAFDAAQLLSRGETSEATTLAGECMMIAGREQGALWLRHYATTRFKIANRAVDDFLGGVPPTHVAL
jgi:hypothetical protein